MKFSDSWGTAALAAVLVAGLNGCGGGGGGGGGGLPITATGGGGSGGTTPANSVPGTLSGTAATGAAFGGATLTIVDQSGTVVCATQTDDQGRYSCTLPSTAKTPLVLTAQRDEQLLYSATSNASGTANVTPLTTVIVSQLSPDGHPAHLASAIQANADAASEERLKQRTSALGAALQPVLNALGQAAFEPITGPLQADGTGQDKVLDALSVSVRPDDGAANIEITVKALPPSDGSAPASIIFRSSDASIPPLPGSITPNQLAGIPSPALLEELLGRLNSCFQLPLSQRVRAPNDDTAVTGGAADVLAPACRALFLGDDPANYLNSGYGVGRDASNFGGFTSLFRPDATGRKWDRANLEYFRENGDITLSYRATDPAGTISNGTLTVRKAGETLKFVGDGHPYGASVKPLTANRDMINSPMFNAYTTGYGMPVRNRLAANGTPLFSKVLVTTPLNSTYTLVPAPGLSFLVMTKEDGVTPVLNNVVNLRGIYQNPSAPGRLADREPSIGLLNPQYTDAQISQLRDQSVWKFEFVHAQSGVPNVIQYERTLSRAQTIGEIQQTAFVDLTPAMRSQLVARTNAASGLVFGPNSTTQPNVLNISATGDQDAWTVPQGALAPSVLTAYGFAPYDTVNNKPGAAYNDAVALAGTTRKARIDCSPESASDKHCDPSFSQQYAEGTRVHFLAFEATNSRGVGVTRYMLFYKQQ